MLDKGRVLILHQLYVIRDFSEISKIAEYVGLGQVNYFKFDRWIQNPVEYLRLSVLCFAKRSCMFICRNHAFAGDSKTWSVEQKLY